MDVWSSSDVCWEPQGLAGLCQGQAEVGSACRKRAGRGLPPPAETIGQSQQELWCRRAVANVWSVTNQVPDGDVGSPTFAFLRFAGRQRLAATPCIDSDSNHLPQCPSATTSKAPAPRTRNAFRRSSPELEYNGVCVWIRAGLQLRGRHQESAAGRHAMPACVPRGALQRLPCRREVRYGLFVHVCDVRLALLFLGAGRLGKLRLLGAQGLLAADRASWGPGRQACLPGVSRRPRCASPRLFPGPHAEHQPPPWSPPRQV